MSSKIVAVLFIVLSYTSKSVTFMHNAKNGTVIIGESNEIDAQGEPALRRDDDRIKVICSNLTEQGDNRHDEYTIAKFLAGNDTPTICKDAVESNHGSPDDNKLTREVRQSNENYRFKRGLSDNEIKTYHIEKLLQRKIRRKSIGDEVNKYLRSDMDDAPVEDGEVAQEVNKENEGMQDMTATNQETEAEPEGREEAEGEAENNASLENGEKFVEEENTATTISAPKDEDVPSAVTAPPYSGEQENSDGTTELSESTDEDIPSLVTEDPHPETLNESDDTKNIDEVDEEEREENEPELSATDQEEVNVFMDKLDRILASSGDYIIAVMLNNYKRRMRANHVNEKFWNKVHDMATKSGRGVNSVKNKLERNIRDKLGQPFVKEVAHSLKSFIRDVGLRHGDIE